MKGILLDNFTLLELLGILSQDLLTVKLSPNVVVLRDDVPELEGVPKVFTIDKLFNGTEFPLSVFRDVINTLPYREHLRVFFAHFRPHNGKITQRKDHWDKFKAWRFDIDHPYPEEHILSLIEKLPLQPNIVKKSKKGWHLIYVFDEFVERNKYDRYIHEGNTDGYLHFMVYRLLTSHIPSYLKSIEEKLDVHASSIVNMIATRFVSENLPAYLLHEPYPLSQFFDAFAHLIPEQTTNGQPKPKAKRETLEEAVEGYYRAHRSSPYKVEDIPKETFYSLLNRCEVLKALDKVWENHKYHEWFIMANIQAIKILYAESPEEEQALWQEFHEKSKKHPEYDRQKAHRFLEYAVERQSENLKPPGCGYIYRVIRREFRAICEECPYKRVGPNGLIEGHFIFDALKGLRRKKKAEELQAQNQTQTQKGLRKREKAENPQPHQPPQTHPYPLEEPDGLKEKKAHPYPTNTEEPQTQPTSLEEPPLPNWELREDGWYMLDNGVWVRVLPYFRITARYVLGEDEAEYVEIEDAHGRTHLKKVEREKGSRLPTLEFIENLGDYDPDRVKEARRFLAHYIQKVKRKKRNVWIEFIGYRYIDGTWHIVVGGDKYTRRDLSVAVLGIRDLTLSYEWFLPSVEGDLETFKDTYRKLFALNDPPLHFAIAHFLSWVAKQFFGHHPIVPRINPILIFVGDPGTGKTVRGEIASALYGNPKLISFTNNTLAVIFNRYSLFNTPFGIDEVITKKEKYEEKFGELIYNITNIQGKGTSPSSYNPITVPVLFTAETVNLPIDKILEAHRGLNRRAVIIKLTTEWEHNAEVLDEAIETLFFHHGHILHYVRGLTEKDKAWIEEVAKSIYDYINLEGGGFKGLRKHIALSLATFAHFFLFFIQACTVEEINRKLKSIVDFVVKEITRHQLGYIGKYLDYVEEIMGFLSKLDEFSGKHPNVKLKGLSFRRVCNLLNYTPPHKVEELLIKFFWKRYTESDGTGTKLYFTPSCLIERPGVFQGKFVESKPEVIYDRERLVGFTKEEARIWFEVFRLRHGDVWVKYLVNTFELDKLPQFQKLVSSLPEQLLRFPEKPKEPEEDPEEPEEPEEDFDF
jgi:hypothetical protein